jgi:serine protease
MVRATSTVRAATKTHDPNGSLVAGGLAALALIVAVLASACTGDITEYSTTEPGAPKGPVHFVRAVTPIANRYIVVLRDDAGFKAQDFDATQTQLVASYRASVVQSYRHALKGFVAEMSEADALALADDPMVAFVQEDGVVHMTTTQSGATWGIDRIDQRTLPLSGTYTYNADGTGVSAYVIDTGIHITHTELGGRAHAGYSSISDGNGSDDCNGHGTHVSGTIGGTTYGVAKNVQLYAVRVLDCSGSGSDSGVVAGVDWVTAHAQLPAVANMSLGGGASPALDTAVRNSIAAGVVYGVAAGNDNLDACSGSPSDVAEAITVGATGSSDSRASYSDWGTCVDIFAPGSNIKSSWGTSNTATNTISGTSMATPHVVGAAALYLSANPSATPAQVASALTGNASTGVGNRGSGSPDKLLYTGFIGGGTTPPPPPPPPPGGTVVLQSGTAAAVPTLSTGASQLYSIVVPAGSSSLTVTTSGGSGDADLYVKAGAAPTTTSYDKASEGSTTAETATISSPAAGTYYVLVSAYSSITGVSVKATVAGSTPPPGGDVLQSGVPVTGLSGATGAQKQYTFTVPAGAASARFQISGGTGDADLYVRFGAAPTTTQYDYRPYLVGNNETVNVSNPQAGTWYVMVRAYATYSGTSLVATSP